jgi:hypothetical protein
MCHAFYIRVTKVECVNEGGNETNEMMNMLLECCERSLNDIRRQSVLVVYVGKETSMAEIWHTDVQ